MVDLAAKYGSLKAPQKSLSFEEKYAHLKAPATATDDDEATIFQRAIDTGIDFAKGVVDAGESVVGAADLASGNLIGHGLRRLGYDPARTRQILESGYSKERQQENQDVHDADGFLNTVIETVHNPSVGLGTIVESAPMLVGAAGAVRSLATNMLAKQGLKIGTKEAVEFLNSAPVKAKLAAAGGAAEGLMSAGSNQEQARQAGRKYGESAPYSALAGIGTAVIGTVAGKVGLGDVETAAGTLGFGTGATSLGKRIASGMFQEGALEELPQSAQEQIFSNLSMGKQWDEGVPEASATGLLAGAGMGGFVRALDRRNPELTTAKQVDRIMAAPTVDDAIKAAGDAVNTTEEVDLPGDLVPTVTDSIEGIPTLTDKLDIPTLTDVVSPEELGDMSGTALPVDTTALPVSKTSGQTFFDELARITSGRRPIDANAPTSGTPDALVGNAPEAPESLAAPPGGKVENPFVKAPHPAPPTSAISTTNEAAKIDLDEMAHQAATSPQNDLPEPTDAQKEAGNYKKGHIKLQGLDIAIENPQGSTRSGTSPDGAKWENTMGAHYGYIKRTEGADGEQVDTFIGDNPASDKVFVVDQITPDGSFDEHKVMMGFDDQKGAEAGYLANYSKGWKIGPVTAMSMDEFKGWLNTGDNKLPLNAELAERAALPLPEVTELPVEEVELAPSVEAPSIPVEKGNAPRETPARKSSKKKEAAESKGNVTYHVSPLPKFDGTREGSIREAQEQWNRLDDQLKETDDPVEYDRIKSKMRSLDKIEKALKANKRAFGDNGQIDGDSFYTSSQPEYWRDVQADELGLDYGDGGIYAVQTKSPVEESMVPSGMGQQAPESTVALPDVVRILGPFKTKAEADKAIEASQDAKTELPAIITASKPVYLKQMQKAAGIKKGSPGYDAAVERIEEQYETELDKAYASLPFEKYNELNSEVPEALNRQAYDQLRKEYGGGGEVLASQGESTERFDIGRALTKQQRNEVLKTLEDVYKLNNVPKEERQDRRGETIYRYPYSPEYFVKSDITGSMLRYYVTLPDKRIAHPSELFPDYTQSNIDKEMLRRQNIERNARSAVNREVSTPFQFNSVFDAGTYWDEKSDQSKKNSMNGWATISSSFDRTTFTKDGKFVMVPAGYLAEFVGFAEELKSQGWKKYSARGSNETLASQDAVTGTPAFKKWFGKSKVVDADGNPLVVYHGTFNDFQEFDPERAGESGFSSAKGISEFTDDPDIASHYAGGTDEQARWGHDAGSVMPVYLKIENPLIFDKSDHHGDYGYAHRFAKQINQYLNGDITPEDSAEVGSDFLKQKELSELLSFIKENGLPDGIIVKNANWDSYGTPENTQYQIFSGAQAKSAIGNTGAFSPDDPSILAADTGNAPQGWLTADSSVPDPMTVAEVEAAVAEPMKGLKQQFGTDVIVVKSLADAGMDPNKRYRGAYKAGKVYLFANNLQSARMAQVVLAHELIGHKGILAAVTPEEWTAIKKSIADLLKFNSRFATDVAKETSRRYDNYEYQSDNWYKEFLAVAAERREKRGTIGEVMAKLKAALRRFLKALGFTNLFSDSELEIILENSERYLREAGAANMATDEALAASQAAPFYSALLNTIKTNTSSPRKGNADQWKSWLDGRQKAGEIKKAERDWLGLDEWLDGRDSTTRDELAAYVKGNQAQVEDVVLGKKILSADIPEDSFSIVGDDRGEELKITSTLQASENSEGAPELWWEFSNGESGSPMFNSVAEARRWAESSYDSLTWSPEFNWSESNLDLGGAPKFANYQLPGGENYRELLLTLPRSADFLKQKTIRSEVVAEFKERTSEALSRTYSLNKQTQKQGRDDFDKLISEREMEISRRGGETVVPFRSTHFDQPNILAHVRFNERTDANGNKVLFLEELQSDWAQSGRKNGFNDITAADQAEYDTLVSRFRLDRTEAENARVRELEERGANSPKQRVPTMPFKGTDEWSMLAFKHMLRWAVDNGFDSIAWTTGEQQADRYDLSKQVSEVRASRLSGGQYGIEVLGLNHDIVFQDDVSEEKLADIVGKELAEKIVKQTTRDAVYSGNGLKVGGEGMRGFYDQILPSAVNKWAKKFGGKVGRTTIDVQGRPEQGTGLSQRMEYVGPEHTERSVAAATSRYATSGDGSVSVERQLQAIQKAIRDGADYKDAILEHGSISAAEALGGNLKPLASVLATQPSLTITDAMREAADAGLPLFSREDQTSTPAKKTTTVAGTFDAIRRHAESMGFDVDMAKGSSLSKSQYLELSKGIGEPDENGDYEDYDKFRIRVSDHVLPPTYKLVNGVADFEASPDSADHQDTDGNWYQALNWLSKKTGVPLQGQALRQMREYEDTKRRINEQRDVENQRRQSSQSAYEKEQLPIWGRFGNWIRTLPADARIQTSNSGNVSALSADGNPISSFGKKPAGFSKSFNTVAQAARWVELKLPVNNPDILASQGEDEYEEGDSANFAVPDETLLTVAVRKMQDKFKVLKDLQANIQAAGGKITDDNDAYLAEELFHGKAENDLREMRDQYVEPLAEKMGKFDISREQLDQYLYARHARERNEYVASINPKMKDGGSGMTNAEADTILAMVKKTGKQDQYDQLAAIVDDLVKLQRDMIVEGGLEDDGLIAAWQATYQHYVPLKGWAEDTKDQGRPRIGAGFNIGGRESKRAMGRSSKAASPTSYAIVDLTEKLIRRRKNGVGNVLEQLIADNPNSGYWETFTDENPEMDRKIVKVRNEAGDLVDQVKEVALPMAMLKDRYFTTKKAGKTYYMRLKDERLMRAMKNLGPESNGALLRTLAGINRVLSALNTSYSPEFMISNFARDVQTAILNLQAEQSLPPDKGKASGKAIAAQTIKDIPKAMRAIYGVLRGAKDTGEWGKMFEQFRADGAKTGYFDMKDLDGQAAEIDRLVQIAQGGWKGNALRWAKGAAKIVETMNGSVENAVRLSAYVNAIKAGLSPKRAASLAKNMTVNFNRRGEVGTTLNALYMFANASIQGTANFVRTMGTLKGDGSLKWENLNNAQKLAVGITAAAMFLSMANRAAAGDDDDGENWYDKVPDYVKERNIVLMKSLFGGEQNGEYWKIPLPYGFNVFSVLGDNIASVADGGESALQAAGNVTLAALGSFSPIGYQDSKTVQGLLLKNAAPTVAKPVVELALNENFAGSTIFSENFPFGTPKPDSALGRRSTPAAYKQVANWLNEVTGGSEYRAGAIDVNPDVMQYVLDYMGGSAYSFFGSKVPDYLYRQVTGTEPEIGQIPFISRISGRVLPYEDTDRFYDRRDRIGQIEDEYKALTPAERLEYPAKFRTKLQLRGLLKQTETELRALRKRRDVIYAADLTAKTRDQRLKEVEARMKAAVDRFNKRWTATE